MRPDLFQARMVMAPLWFIIFWLAVMVVAILTFIMGLPVLPAHAVDRLPGASTAPVTGSFIIAGNGPELRTIERLAGAFEKSHLGSIVEIQWDQYEDPIAMVKSGEAQVAVTGRADPSLAVIPIAWDGIAVVVYSGNPTKEVTRQQVAAIFSGKMKRWSELSGQETAIQLINRPLNQNIRLSFEAALGIAGQIPSSAPVIRSDQKAMGTVAGSLSAVAYVSLKPALDAVKYGVDVNLLMIDRVEAAEETVKDGRYRLRRPVLLLSRKEPNPVAEAFAVFALSKEGQEIVAEMFTPYSSVTNLSPTGGTNLTHLRQEELP